MPFTIDIDTSGPVRAIGSMISSITIFGTRGIRRELESWQTDEMHRDKAWAKKIPWRAHRAGAFTIIRPHSKFEVERSRAYQAGQRRKARGAARRKKPIVIANPHPKTSTRPILRAQLIELLAQRMKAAMLRDLTWSAPANRQKQGEK